MDDTRMIFLTDRQFSTLCSLLESASLAFDSNMSNSREVIKQFYDDFYDLNQALDHALEV